jgi:hypothetical protein
MEINKKKKKGSQAKNDKCMAKLLLERRKRVESGTGTSVRVKNVREPGKISRIV